jgi:uncharacterized protein (DUF1499 family)
MLPPWYVRAALILSLLLPVYFVVAALGTKFGIWGWRTGLGTMVIGAGPVLIWTAAILAMVVFGATIVKRPRRGWKPALVALAIPLIIFAGLSVLRARSAAIPPIHDVATDTAAPPSFSAELLAERAAANANPVQAYDRPLGTLKPWQNERFAAIASKSHADIIDEHYGSLAPIALGDTSRDKALDIVADTMRSMGFSNIRLHRDAGSVEATAETFWYGFKDDVVVRIADDKIDMRSVSRVGLSDLGANAARIAELQKRVKARIKG